MRAVCGQSKVLKFPDSPEGEGGGGGIPGAQGGQMAQLVRGRIKFYPIGELLLIDLSIMGLARRVESLQLAMKSLKKGRSGCEFCELFRWKKKNAGAWSIEVAEAAIRPAGEKTTLRRYPRYLQTSS